MRVRSSCPLSSELLEGLNQRCPSWGITQDPQGWSSQSSPAPSAETGPAPISIHTISQVTPLLFSSFFNLFQPFLLIRSIGTNTEAAAHPWGKACSSILDGTSVTSDTQPAGLLCFLPPLFFSLHLLFVTSQFGERFLSLSSLYCQCFGHRLLYYCQRALAAFVQVPKNQPTPPPRPQ